MGKLVAFSYNPEGAHNGERVRVAPGRRNEDGMSHLGNDETGGPWCGDKSVMSTYHCGDSTSALALAYMRGKVTCSACLEAHPRGREVLGIMAQGVELNASIKAMVESVASRAWSAEARKLLAAQDLEIVSLRAQLAELSARNARLENQVTAEYDDGGWTGG